MTKRSYLPLLLAIAPVAMAIIAAPAMALPQSPSQASQEIDVLAKEVYRPGNAKKANQDLDRFCAEVGEKLRGFERAQWEPVARKCGEAQRRMKEYNPGRG